MVAGRSICVVGAGVAGLASALALAQRGAKVTLLEQAPEITEVGAGLQISPNGLVVLRALGLEPALKSSSIRGRAVSLRNGDTGREVAQLDMREMPPQQSYYFVHRADLVGLLEQAVRAAGVRIELGRKVLSANAAGQIETSSDTAPAERSTTGADLVIGADGLQSKLRMAINSPQDPTFTGQVAWRTIVPNVTAHPAHVRVHMGAGRHLVSYPLRDGRYVNVVAVEERDDWAAEGWSHPDSPRNLRAAYATFDPEVHALLQGVERCFLWGLFRHPVAEHWHDGKGRMAIVGDAAHPTLPFLAQGANMALEDAWVLADCLDTIDNPARALETYQARRMFRVRRVIAAANGNAWKYHLRPGPLRLAAHSGLRMISTFAPGRLLSQFDWLYGHDVTAPQDQA